MQGMMLCKTPLMLEFIGDDLLLAVSSLSNQKPFTLDLSQRYPSKGKDPLLRAVGQSSGSLLDLTGGWCRDAIHIARAGMNVQVFEKNPLIYSMVKHALTTKIDLDCIAGSLTLSYGDSVEMLAQHTAQADVIYLDPMYPHRASSASSPKEITVLKSVLELEDCSSINTGKELFIKAMGHAKKRVIVKRPHFAPPVDSSRVGEILARQVRFDIYNPN